MATDLLEVTLETLTPIWTGGTNGKADRLHITGIMGSLRWWYEMIVRGLGGRACDPSKGSCIYDPDAPSSSLCDVCKVFGATGWARRFRLVINDERQLRPDHLYDRRPIASQTYKNRSGKTVTPTWYLNGPPLSGHIDIQIIATDRQFPVEVIGALLQFLADWASVGAKPQMGLGTITISPHQETQYLTTYLANHITPLSKDNKSPSFSLRDMFFVGMSAERFPPNETFNLKYDLRRLFQSNRNLRHFVMGTVEGERQGTQIMITNPHNNNTSLRVWGWIPEEVSQFGTSREQVIKLIHSRLTTNSAHSHYKVNYWREFNSIRDTTQIQYINPQEFLDKSSERCQMIRDYIIYEAQKNLSSISELKEIEQQVQARTGRDKREVEEVARQKRQAIIKASHSPSTVYQFLAATKEADATAFRTEWQSRNENVTHSIDMNVEAPEIDLALLPTGSFVLQFTFTLARPYISRDEQDFYIIDNPIRKEKVFELPYIAPTSWKGGLRAALWRLGFNSQDEAIYRLFGNEKGEENQDELHAGRLYFFPTFFTQKSLEIINPHDRERRVGKNPILFESVPGGVKGGNRKFHFALRAI